MYETFLHQCSWLLLAWGLSWWVWCVWAVMMSLLHAVFGLSWWVFCMMCVGCHDEPFVWCVGCHDESFGQSWWCMCSVMMSLLSCHDESFGLSWGYLWAVMRILVGCHDDACHDDNGMMMMMTMGMRGDYDNCGGWWCPPPKIWTNYDVIVHGGVSRGHWGGGGPNINADNRPLRWFGKYL